MRRPKPHQIVLAIGVLAAIGTIASGIAPQITHWHDDSPMAREVFVNVPGGIQVAFYLVMATMLFVTAWLVSLRVRNYERGGPDDRRLKRSNAERRMRDFRRGVWMRTLLRDPAAGVMHSMIYFGFLVLFAATVLLEIDHQLPTAMKFLHGTVYEGYAFMADLFGLVFLGGILWALARRYVQRPYRIRIKTKPEHAAILGVLLGIGLTGFGAEAFRIAQQSAAGANMDFEKWSFVGYPLSQAFDGLAVNTLETWHQIWWVGHVLAFVAFLLLLPITDRKSTRLNSSHRT